VNKRGLERLASSGSTVRRPKLWSLWQAFEPARGLCAPLFVPPQNESNRPYPACESPGAPSLQRVLPQRCESTAHWSISPSALPPPKPWRCR